MFIAPKGRVWYDSRMKEPLSEKMNESLTEIKGVVQEDEKKVVEVIKKEEEKISEFVQYEEKIFARWGYSVMKGVTFLATPLTSSSSWLTQH